MDSAFCYLMVTVRQGFKKAANYNYFNYLLQCVGYIKNRNL
ncbi:Uncharacterised protein [Legionella gratiana]|uniref:Uncharacterized protein n=1 Tax=Legionella gratiana TaxID=45066 RepID=A0A378JBP3_9GAMM|nr:Uncharacterised protein [Legionella gratiana]